MRCKQQIEKGLPDKPREFFSVKTPVYPTITARKTSAYVSGRGSLLPFARRWPPPINAVNRMINSSHFSPMLIRCTLTLNLRSPPPIHSYILLTRNTTIRSARNKLNHCAFSFLPRTLSMWIFIRGMLVSGKVHLNVRNAAEFACACFAFSTTRLQPNVSTPNGYSFDEKHESQSVIFWILNVLDLLEPSWTLSTFPLRFCYRVPIEIGLFRRERE